MSNPLTAQEVGEIVRMRRLLIPYRKIALALGVSIGTVSNYCKMNGLNEKRNNSVIRGAHEVQLCL